MSRHGGTLHFVRPDRIVRTGVLSPIVGYQPQQDVLAVTQEFTSGPASGMQLAGLGSMHLLGPSWLDRVTASFRNFGQRVKAAVHARKAQRLMLTAPQNATAAIAASVAAPAGPAIMHGHGISPQLQSMSDMTRFLAMRGVLPMRGEMIPQRRWNTYYFAG